MTPSPRFPRGFFAALLILGLAIACKPKPPANELVVGMDLSYPPFETIDPSGKPVGVSVEIAEALAASMGQSLRIENIPFTGLIPSLQTGKIDCIISSMTDTPERRGSVAFSDPYVGTGLALLVGKNSSASSMADIDQPGKMLAVRQGTTGEIWARANIKNAGILSLEKEAAAVLEVIQGKADAFLYDQMSIWKNAREQPEKTRALLSPVRKEQWAVALRHEDSVLREKINNFLRDFRAAGGFDKLGDQYLGEQKADFQKQGIEFYF
ncbi:MAG: transporter substrate-binding domain-containing protein [Terrimicrobiaceae bacterium]